jgi:FMN-dependent NADH-azoreductase
LSTILLVKSSPSYGSVSSTLAKELAAGLSASSGAVVVHRDVGTSPPAHLDAVLSSAIRKPADQRDAPEAAAAAVSDLLVDELLAADVIVIGTGVVNFGVYSGLKSWIDNVARAGRTFRYGAGGPEGLVGAKTAYVVVSSGGVYSQGPAAAADHASSYVETVLRFLGVQDVRLVRAEGLAFGEEAAKGAIDAARAAIAAHVSV